MYLAVLLLLSFCCVTHLYGWNKAQQGKEAIGNSISLFTVHCSFVFFCTRVRRK